MPNLLAAKARALTEQLRGALAWTNKSSFPGIANNYRLQKDLRRSIFQTKKLERAASSKMCVGVYGASQAGKSYLVSVLARRGTSALTAVLGDREVDFIRHINPEGGKESTGLVTRFTIDRVETPENFPIKAKLLSELDLIKIFVNSFSYDILPDEHDDIDQHLQDIERVLASVESLPHGVSPIAIEDVFDLEEYCNSRFVSNTRLQALKKSDFWARAPELLPRLGEDGRVKMIELLWEGIPALTRTYRLLAAELRRLSYPEFVYCASTALFDLDNEEWVRSVHSIINVSTLDGLGSPDARSLDVLTDQNVTASISISTLCGLISELIIPLKETPHDFFEFTDLLDFPGARSRNARPKNNELLSSTDVQVENYLRGKVAYLFDKYSSEFELSSMLLCVGPSNQEVSGLPRLVEDWVEKTHGKSPEERDKLPNALFLVLTKFDQEFSQGAGRTSDGTRWSTRLEASLLKPFGAHSHRTSWVNRWDSNGPFRNTYWLRNPNVDQLGLIQYQGEAGNSPEIGFVAERVNHISLLRQEFVTNSSVLQHFQNPSDAWEAGMQLNDGGIQYLVQGLRAICRPLVKARQVEEQINGIAQDREQDLKKYFVSTAIQDIAREKNELAERFLQMGGLLFQKQRLGEFIDFILVSDTDTQEVFRRVENQYEREKNASRVLTSEGNVPAETLDAGLANILGISAPKRPITSADNQQDNISGDFPDRFVLNFFSEWSSSVLSKAGAGNSEAYLHIERDLLAQLLLELERSAHRTGLVDNLKQLMKANYQYKSSNLKSWMLKQTAIMTGLFNQFLVRGGCTADPERRTQQINTFNGNLVSIFAAQPEVIQIEIPEIAEDFSKTYLIDWLQAVQYSIRMNAEFVSTESGDTASNRELGELLVQLSNVTKLVGEFDARN
jgi:hypothetical protein